MIETLLGNLIGILLPLFRLAMGWQQRRWDRDEAEFHRLEAQHREEFSRIHAEGMRRFWPVQSLDAQLARYRACLAQLETVEAGVAARLREKGNAMSLMHCGHPNTAMFVSEWTGERYCAACRGEEKQRQRAAAQSNQENELNKPLPPPDLIFTTQGHPEANGRTPRPGDRGYLLTFGLDDGCSLQIRASEECFQHFRKMLAQMDADDAAERLLG